MLDPKVYTFLKVVETGSYTAAAKALHLTQPAVTQHIAKIEEYYGTSLFLPEGRGVKLSDAGRRFLHYARMQQSNENSLLDGFRGIETPLRLGSTLSIADYYLPELIIPLCKNNDMRLNIKVGNTEKLLDGLVKGELDAAFIEGIFDRSLFEAKVFYTPEFIPVVAMGHPLSGKVVSLEQLHDYPLILREHGSGTRAIAENYLTLQNDSPNSFAAVWELGSFALIKQVLQNSFGVSFMYEAVAGREIEEKKLCRLNIEGYTLRHSLHFVYLKSTIGKKRIEEFYKNVL